MNKLTHQPHAVALAFTQFKTAPNTRQLLLDFNAQGMLKKRNPPFADVAVKSSAVQKSSYALSVCNSAQAQVLTQDVVVLPLRRVSGCLNAYTASLPRLAKLVPQEWSRFAAWAYCQRQTVAAMPALKHTDWILTGTQQRWRVSGLARQSFAPHYSGCLNHTYGKARYFARDLGGNYIGKALHRCQAGAYTLARRAPCDFYPIALPPNPHPPDTPQKPEPNQLPLLFQRAKQDHSPKQAPLWFGEMAHLIHIVPKESYTVLNTLSARCGSLKLNPFAASAQSDMNGFYWSCSVDLPPDDFAALQLNERQTGDEAVIEVVFNRTQKFVFLAEEVSDNRVFGKRSYTVSGRSLTAKLGADYAQFKKGLVAQELYAQQIAREVLADLGFTLNWQIADWLVPSSVYSLNDKTPMAVLADIAQAGGGFIASDPEKPVINVLPRWQVAAWRLNHSSASVSVPANVILAIKGNQHSQAQYDAVFVYADHEQGRAAKVVRQGKSGDQEAATLTHPLYTDLTVCEAAAIAALSDSGNHKTETIALPYLPEHGLNLAQVGQIWRFSETNEAFNAVIKSVQLSASVQNDVPRITQVIRADRYLGG